MRWTDLGAAIGIMLVLEGIVPFLNPQGLRRVLQAMAALPDTALRGAGFSSMAVGTALLFLING